MLLAFTLGLTNCESAPSPPPKPNATLILADDLGFFDFGCHGDEFAPPGIMHRPGVIPAGGKLRHAPAHSTDFLPTVLGLVGPTSPENLSGHARPALPGKSLVPLLNRATAISREAVYWQHEGNHSLRTGDGKPVCKPESAGRLDRHHLKPDRIESKNLTASQPAHERQMLAAWRQMGEEFRCPAGAAKVDKLEPRLR